MMTEKNSINSIKAKNIIITADDFAMSKGVSLAILELCQKKLLDRASVMVGAPYYKKYINELKEQRAKNGVKIGLHLDLTYGKATSLNAKNSIITDENGVFNKGFLGIFLLSLLRKKSLKYFLFREVKSQFRKLENDVNFIDYLDGHQHIHTIPLVFQITKRILKKYQISDQRIINERFFSSVNFNNFPSPISIVKWLVLRSFYHINKAKTNRYFYSILYSCKIDLDGIKKMKNITEKQIEIMLHPGYSSIDILDLKNKELKHLTSKYRDLEYQNIFSLKRAKISRTN